MNIYALKGHKVKLETIDAGYNYQKEQVIKYLDFGKEYTVDYTDVYSSCSDVYLEEFPDIPFNSVFFEDVIEQPYELNKQHPDYNLYNNH